MNDVDPTRKYIFFVIITIVKYLWLVYVAIKEWNNVNINLLTYNRTVINAIACDNIFV